MFTLRADGRFQTSFRDEAGRRHFLYDRDAERLLLRLQEATAKAAAAWSFEQAADAWSGKHFARIAGKTAEAYAAPLRRVKDHFRGELAEDVSAQAVQAFLSDLGKRGFSRRSVQMHRDVLNMIFNNCILEGRLSYNPVASVSVPRGLPASKRELPSDAALEAVKRGAGEPFGLFALVCLYAGLRRGEALALRFEDIDRERRLIHVSRSVEYVGNSPKIKGTKTAAGVRDVPLLAPLAAALPSGSGLIFAREDGGPLSKTQYRKRWERYCSAIGFKISAHQLRHGFATILYEAGIPDKDAQELLGHSSIAVTRDVYTHLRQRQKAATAARLDAFLAGDA